ncbi:MAG: phosphoribosylformylglycinamidine synthase subunit PurS [Lactobacillus crispatus]|jgi:phosphoribosylformylglycinamidine synthase|nr:phosphoribosylformylglycinamidine synthase subunit PurS [Lactobacillus crispatus]MCI1335612.1 phosphoribosylformylglycinamidine synthase subunit PurS [Lactobacillus crispatus]MCI1364806.1 phosphoribosylformylglycinamidine synthase subunit PurS [Lactobacillus crispatus]MCI1493052.1 phosphoribosylformylglycinamidine synthase subunit PurS [Lactobacillus crispatus]MCI1524058.1 phosphoribosylformylglycinamidine synthase subunit PurS [Lactobacillus crispatus]
MTTIRIYVTYKPSVFDPQGAAITDSVNSLGHKEVKNIVVGKFFDITLDETDQEKAKEDVKEIAEALLVNFNMETYHLEVLEEN